MRLYLHIWIEERRELVIATSFGMLVIGPRTLSASVMWRGRDRGFLLHPGCSCWL